MFELAGLPLIFAFYWPRCRRTQVFPSTVANSPEKHKLQIKAPVSTRPDLEILFKEIFHRQRVVFCKKNYDRRLSCDKPPLLRFSSGSDLTSVSIPFSSSWLIWGMVTKTKNLPNCTYCGGTGKRNLQEQLGYCPNQKGLEWSKLNFNSKLL